jgi:hypothetical protein
VAPLRPHDARVDREAAAPGRADPRGSPSPTPTTTSSSRPCVMRRSSCA